MPVYAFSCRRCGPFDVWRPLSEAGEPARCPTCARAGRRVYTPPGVVRTPAHVRKARGLEEKSAHEPDVVREPQGHPLPLHRHGPDPPWALGR